MPITWPYLSYSSVRWGQLSHRFPDFYVHEGARWITGTFFMIAGQTILADIFEPVRSSSSSAFAMTTDYGKNN